MFVILIGEIALATTACINHGAAKQMMKTGFDNTMKTYEANEDEWDYLQQEVRGKSIFFFLFPRYIETNFYSANLIQLGCCGVNGFEDWKNVSLSYPRSCYRPPDYGQMYAQGCREAMYSFLVSDLSSHQCLINWSNQYANFGTFASQ